MSHANTTEPTCGGDLLNGKGLLLKFINNGAEWPSPWSREWLYAPELQVYVRKGLRWLEGGKIKTLEIASIDVYDRGQGTFTDFFHFALSVSPYAVLVECVQTERFCDFFRRYGMMELPNGQPPSFLWLK